MKYLERIIVSCFALVAVYCIVQFIDATFDRNSWVRLDASAWASWVQAVGSLAAIYGALWIYQAQAKSSAAEADIVAKLAAAKLMPQVALLSGEVAALVQMLEQQQQIDAGPDLFRRIIEKLEQTEQWPLDDLARLAPLPNHTAFRLASGLGRLDTGRRLLQNAYANPKMFNDYDFRHSAANQASFVLNESAKFLSQAATQMQLHGALLVGPYSV